MPTRQKRSCTDIYMWNATLTEGADFSEYDIPICPSTIKQPPTMMISYPDAITIYRREMAAGNYNFHVAAIVHTFVYEPKFDGIRSGIWTDPHYYLEVTSHFDGIVTPDFSTFMDFPDPLKRFNIYRSRAVGFFAYKNGQDVMNNARWGAPDTWGYSFAGLPKNSIICIGTVASGLKDPVNREIFNEGLRELINRTHPHTLVIYGSTRYSIIDSLRDEGINVVTFQSDTSLAYERRNAK